MKRHSPLAAILAGFCFFSTASGGDAERAFSIELGEQTVAFREVRSSVSGAGPLVLSLHANERTSFPHVLELLKVHPGRFVSIDGHTQRRLSLKDGSRAFTIDPNRMFSAEGIERDLKNFSYFSPEIAAEIGDFGRKYLKEAGITQGVVVVSVHNNTNGGYSSQSYLEGGSEAAAAAEVSLAEEADPDDFVLVTAPTHFSALKDKGINLILQDNRAAPDDGSLSVYCGRNGIPYINVEAEFGHGEQQRRLIEMVFQLLAGRAPLNSTPQAPSKKQLVPIKPKAVPLD